MSKLVTQDDLFRLIEEQGRSIKRLQDALRTPAASIDAASWPVQKKHGGGIPGGNLGVGIVPDGTGGNMSISFTPVRNCFWDVIGWGNFQGNTASVWSNGLCGIRLSPADRDGLTDDGYTIFSTYQASVYMGGTWSARYRLLAGTAYTASVYLFAIYSGTIGANTAFDIKGRVSSYE